MNEKLAQVAERIKGLRELLDIPVAEMAEITGCTVQEYLAAEAGERDFSFTFLFKCAKRLGVDITELLTGEGPRLTRYSLVRRGEGLPIKRRSGFKYGNLAYLFKDRYAEPFIVTAPYSEEEQHKPIPLSTHEGQEMDYVLKGSLMVEIDGHTEILKEGDTIYYDASRPHGMIATAGQECVFLAVVISGAPKV